MFGLGAYRCARASEGSRATWLDRSPRSEEPSWIPSLDQEPPGVAALQTAERYRVEPYVVAADVASVPPHVGRGGWTWYTGAAAWTWRLGIEGILGIRRVEGGVRIDPCIPTSWGHAEARLRGPAGTLVVSIEDPEGVGRGVVGVEVDGKVLRDGVVHFPEDGGERRVIVRLGPVAK